MLNPFNDLPIDKWFYFLFGCKHVLKFFVNKHGWTFNHKYWYKNIINGRKNLYSQDWD